MTLEQLKKRLEEIKSLGFVKTHRKGDTGIGKTLEDLLGIEENNIPLPDISSDTGGIAELKAYRKSAASMLTLFTLEPKPRGGDRDRYLLDNFGYSKRENNRPKELHSTLSSKRYNNQGLKTELEKDKVRVVGEEMSLDVYWNMEDLKKKFEAKIPALVYVLADSKNIEGVEYFHFNEAYFLEGFDFEHFKDMMKRDAIVVDFRMYYRPNRAVRNHGTGFRVKIRQLYDCFEQKVQLI